MVAIVRNGAQQSHCRHETVPHSHTFLTPVSTRPNSHRCDLVQLDEFFPCMHIRQVTITGTIISFFYGAKVFANNECIVGKGNRAV